MLIPSVFIATTSCLPSLSRRVNANSQQDIQSIQVFIKLIKKGEC